MSSIVEGWLESASGDLKNINYIINEEILSAFDDLYIDSRYPGNFGLLPYGKPTIEDAKEFYELAEDIYQYILPSPLLASCRPLIIYYFSIKSSKT